MLKSLNYVWRLIRPHVYTVGDYAFLVETNPNALTMREVRSLQSMAGGL